MKIANYQQLIAAQTYAGQRPEADPRLGASRFAPAVADRLGAGQSVGQKPVGDRNIQDRDVEERVGVDRSGLQKRAHAPAVSAKRTLEDRQAPTSQAELRQQLNAPPTQQKVEATEKPPRPGAFLDIRV